MVWANGRAPATSLKLIMPGFDLAAPSAAAWSNMALAHHMLHGVVLEPAGPYGAGYRSLSVQQDFWRAGQGDQAAIEKTHLDPNLHVRIAQPGGSSHGWGTRADILFNGRSPDATDLSFAIRYGWRREFGADDKNHFMHDKTTAVFGVLVEDQVRLLAEFLNERHLGRTTKAADTGNREDEDFTWLIQHWGHQEHIYPAACLEDGKRGVHTDHTFDLAWATLADAWKHAHPTPKA